jgi:L-threonylcarbamoyladenylate synthase
VFEAKERPSFDPLIVHLADPAALPAVTAAPELGPRLDVLARRFWPGPLTLVLRKGAAVPDIVTAGLDTVAVRVPDHEAARALIAAAATPVAAPSANPFGYVSPTTAAHVAAQLGDRVELILDGGSCRVGVESTILSLVTEPPTLLRPGGITREELEATLGGRVAIGAGVAERPLAPGQLEKHYATRTPLVVLPGPAPARPAEGARVGLLAWAGAPAAHAYAAVEVLAPDGLATTAAARLFAALRTLDGLGLDRLVAEPCAETGLGRAIMDRLRRCAATPA